MLAIGSDPGSYDVELAEDMGRLTFDPLGFARFAFPWGDGALSDALGPRQWQADILGAIGDHLMAPATRYQPFRCAVASGHGPGKSALISMVTQWAMSTCLNCKVVVTANTEQQLRTKTWPEIAKWTRLNIAGHWFNTTATGVYSSDPNYAAQWRADAVTWSEHNTEAFAGLHNKGSRILLVFDEASKIADKVWEVAEGALTDENTEIIWLAFGNPTRNTGRFKDCFGRFKHRWHTRQIDSRTVDGVNLTEIAKMVADYGEDSDIVKVRVRGMFPSTSQKQFISTEDVDAALDRHLRIDQYDFAPKIISVDPAWEGNDELVIGLRQGLYFRVLRAIAKNDNDVQMANLIATLEDEHHADAVFVDGGYGTGIVSAGRTMGRSWQLVWFAEKPLDPGCLNKRAEMWLNMRDWLKQGGSLAGDRALHAELLGPETVARLDGKLQLESKADMKRRGQASPNRADALAISFAYPVQSKLPELYGLKPREQRVISDYDPWERG